ncbi:unnamed protein product, partial [Rotaria magnacalcarata]
NLNDSYHSLFSDLDGLENEQSLLDDLLYGGITGSDNNNNKTNKTKTHNTSLNSTNHNHHSYSKPPTGRSRSPSLTRVNGIT